MGKRRTKRKFKPAATMKLPVISGILLLPAELLYLILASCSNATLVALAQTCTRLNTIALHAFFQRNSKYDLSKGYLSSFKAPKEMLDAIRTTLSVKSLKSVDWQFDPGCECQIFKPDPLCPFRSSKPKTESAMDAGTVLKMGPLERTFDEVANLQAIFSRLPAVGHVVLNLRSVDSWLSEAHHGIWHQTLDMDLWRKAFVGLLDKILDKGCQTLEVNNGDNLEWLYSDQNAKATTNAVLPTRTKWKGLKLQKLIFRSDMFLTPPFYDWALSLLTSSACADCLLRLSFRPRAIPISSPLLVSLDLPNLFEFEIRPFYAQLCNDAKSTCANFDDVAAFLRTHSAQLKELRLYGVGLPTAAVIRPKTRSMSKAIPVPAFDPCNPILPRLETITAHPTYIVWLLELANSSQSNMALGNLRSINVTSEDYTSGPQFDYALFDDALKAVVKWKNGQRGAWEGRGTRSKNRNKTFMPERTINLTLEFASQGGIEEWFTSYLPSPSRGIRSDSLEPSVLTQLTCISNLTISMVFPIIPPEAIVNTLPDWLALISNSGTSSSSRVRGCKVPGMRSGTPSRLQKVTIVGKFKNDMDPFIERVAEKCVGLKWLQLGYSWFNNPATDLDQLRARAGTEKADG